MNHFASETLPLIYKSTLIVWVIFDLDLKGNKTGKQTGNKTSLYSAYEKGNSKCYCFIINKDGKMDGWVQKRY